MHKSVSKSNFIIYIFLLGFYKYSEKLVVKFCFENRANSQTEHFAELQGMLCKISETKQKSNWLCWELRIMVTFPRKRHATRSIL
jgi:hypothetical protein